MELKQPKYSLDCRDCSLTSAHNNFWHRLLENLPKRSKSLMHAKFKDLVYKQPMTVYLVTSVAETQKIRGVLYQKRVTKTVLRWQITVRQRMVRKNRQVHQPQTKREPWFSQFSLFYFLELVWSSLELWFLCSLEKDHRKKVCRFLHFCASSLVLACWQFISR